MLTVTRSVLNEHLSEVSRLVDVHADGDRYVRAALRWLVDVEASLQRLRSPLSALVAAERARVLASRDGLREDGNQGGRVSVRRAERVATTLALGRVEAALRRRVEAIDERLDGLRDKMAGYLAAASAEVPIPLPSTEPRSGWLSAVWKELGASPSTQGLRVYLGASLGSHDRLVLLDEILANLTASATPAGKGSR